MSQWVPRGGVDLAVAFLSEGPRFEPCPRQLWKKLFQDESSDSHTREWDDNACIIGAWHNSLDRSLPWYLVYPLLKVPCPSTALTKIQMQLQKSFGPIANGSAVKKTLSCKKMRSDSWGPEVFHSISFWQCAQYKPLQLKYTYIPTRCGRVVTDFLPYPKFSKNLLKVS